MATPQAVTTRTVPSEEMYKPQTEPSRDTAGPDLTQSLPNPSPEEQVQIPPASLSPDLSAKTNQSKADIPQETEKKTKRADWNDVKLH